MVDKQQREHCICLQILMPCGLTMSGATLRGTRRTRMRDLEVRCCLLRLQIKAKWKNSGLCLRLRSRLWGGYLEEMEVLGAI